MFKKLLEKVQDLTGSPREVDASQFDDPIAMQTDWTPAKGGGANFGTHKLVEVDSHRMEFRASAGAKIVYLIFLVIGVAVLIGLTVAVSSGQFSLHAAMLIPLFVGLIFSAVGGCLLYFGTAPIVFDTKKESFWKGRKSPDEVPDKASLKYFTELEQIHALQLIKEYCRGDKRSYYSYELNLVLKDGKRINVVDHGNEGKLRDDANTLAAFLAKPVWDAT